MSGSMIVTGGAPLVKQRMKDVGALLRADPQLLSLIHI